MKSEFLNYFKTIGITEPIQHRIEAIFELVERLLPGDQFTDVHVSEYLQEDGTRIYEDIRFYNERGEKGVVARDFMTQYVFNVFSLEREIQSIYVESKDYDFRKATEKSRLIVVTYYPDEVRATFKASKENCDNLFKIYLKLLVTRLKPV